MHLLEQTPFECCKAKVCSSKSPLAEVPAASLELPGGSRAAKNSSQTPRAAPVQFLSLRTPCSPSFALHPEPSSGSFALLLQEGREGAHCWLAELHRLLAKELDVYSFFSSFPQSFSSSLIWGFRHSHLIPVNFFTI